jgi:hypothetical protein
MAICVRRLLLEQIDTLELSQVGHALGFGIVLELLLTNIRGEGLGVCWLRRGTFEVQVRSANRYLSGASMTIRITEIDLSALSFKCF